MHYKNLKRYCLNDDGLLKKNKSLTATQPYISGIQKHLSK